MTSSKRLCAVVLAIAAGPVALASPTLVEADVPYPGPPPFEALLQGEPIVAIGQLLDRSGSVSREFQSPDMEEPVSVQFDDYAFRLVETLKGKLPERFEIRVLAAPQQEPPFEPEVPVLLLLAPDTGENAGRYAISHGGAYPVVDDAVEVVTTRGAETWPVQRVRDELARLKQDLAQRLAESPEPAEAATPPEPVVELPPGVDEEPPGPSAAERSPGLAPPAELEGAEPATAVGPAAELPPEPTPGPGKVPWKWLLLILVILILAVILARRRRRGAGS